MAVSVYEVVRVAYQSRLSKTTLKQGAHIQQPTPWSLPHACAQPYHPGISSWFVLYSPGSTAKSSSQTATLTALLQQSYITLRELRGGGGVIYLNFLWEKSAFEKR